MVDVGDAVDDPHDLPFERLGLLRPGVREDPVDDLVGEVQPRRDQRRLLVVAKPALDELVERRLAGVAEGRVTEIVAQADRLRQVLVEPECARDDTGDPGRLQRVRHSRAVVVAGRVDEDLRLPLEPPEGLRVQDAVPVALERRPDAALLLGTSTTARLVRAHRERRQRALLELAHCGPKVSATLPVSSGIWSQAR